MPSDWQESNLPQSQLLRSSITLSRQRNVKVMARNVNDLARQTRTSLAFLVTCYSITACMQVVATMQTDHTHSADQGARHVLHELCGHDE